jgi:hypothetical protein
MGVLADALKKKFASPSDAMRALGLNPAIIARSVAEVNEGRAEMIGDSKENVIMANTKLLTRKAAVVQGALTAFLAPFLAEDETIDFTPGLRGITNGNYSQKIPLLAKYVAEKGKEHWISGTPLAEDATPEGLHVLLEALSKVAPAEEAMAKGERGEGGKEPMRQAMTDAEPEEDLGSFEGGEGEPEEGARGGMEEENGENEGGMETGGEDPAAEEEDAGEGGVEGIKQFLKGELSPEAFTQLEEMLQALGNEEDAPVEEENPGNEGDAEPDDDQLDETEPTEEEDETGQDEPPMFQGKPKIPGKDNRIMNKGAMDEATVKGLVTVAVQAERAANKALQIALDDARQYVGNLMGCDSAEQVYVKALGIKGIKADRLRGATVGILQEMLHMQPLKTRYTPPGNSSIAQDASTAKGFFDRFPDAARIGTA